MNRAPAATLRHLDRDAVQPFLDQLSAWLLPGAAYGVQHTWPQLYRSDGRGQFVGLFDGDRLLSHCAFRLETARTAAGLRRIALLGSVATDPDARGRGHASRLLQHAVGECRAQGASAVLLWAERPGLYARAGFRPGAVETSLRLGGPWPQSGADAGVRLATIRDHEALHELHRRQPLGIDRDRRTMSGLLTTPGMWTAVRERAGRLDAYACCGKGADLQNWWHELGGDDAALAQLLPLAMALLGQRSAWVLLPPYRPALPVQLGDRCRERATVAGPMVCPLDGGEPPAFWIDGLDSV